MTKLLLLLALLQPMEAQADTIVLDEATVLEAAMHFTPDFDFEAQARAALATDAAAWAAMDEAARAAAVAERTTAIEASVARIGPDTRWRYVDFSRIVARDPTAGTVTIAPVLKEQHPLGWMSPRDVAQLAPGYNLLIPNHRAFLTLAVDPELPAPVAARLAGAQRVHVEIDLALLELLQRDLFAAPAVAARVRLDGPEGPDVASWQSRVPPREILAGSLLREGITLDAIGNHHLNLAGGRLLDPLLLSVPGRECSAQGRLDGHLVVDCRMAVRLEGIDTVADQRFVGGRLVRSAFTAQSAPRERLVRRFEGFLAATLDRPGSESAWRSESGWKASYDGTRWADPEQLAAAPVLVVTAEAPGLDFDDARIRPLGENPQ